MSARGVIHAARPSVEELLGVAARSRRAVRSRKLLPRERRQCARQRHSEGGRAAEPARRAGASELDADRRRARRPTRARDERRRRRWIARIVRHVRRRRAGCRPSVRALRVHGDAERQGRRERRAGRRRPSVRPSRMTLPGAKPRRRHAVAPGSVAIQAGRSPVSTRGLRAERGDVRAAGEEHGGAQARLDGRSASSTPPRARPLVGLQDRAAPARRASRPARALSRRRRPIARRRKRPPGTPRSATAATAAAVGMPQPASSRPSCLLRSRGAQLLDARPARAAGAGDIEAADAGRDEPLRDGAGDPATRLLHPDPRSEGIGQASNGVEAAEERAITPGLHELLRGVQVDEDARRPRCASSAPRRRRRRAASICWAPMLPKRSTSGATSRTANVAAFSGFPCIARCEPTPNATPWPAPTSARSRLIAPARSVPPVMPTTSSGARSVLPRSVVSRRRLRRRELREGVVNEVHMLEERRDALTLDVLVEARGRGGCPCAVRCRGSSARRLRAHLSRPE